MRLRKPIENDDMDYFCRELQLVTVNTSIVLKTSDKSESLDILIGYALNILEDIESKQKDAKEVG